MFDRLYKNWPIRQRFMVVPLLALFAYLLFAAFLIYESFQQSHQLIRKAEAELETFDRFSDLYIMLINDYNALFALILDAPDMEEGVIYDNAKLHLDAVNSAMRNLQGALEHQHMVDESTPEQIGHKVMHSSKQFQDAVGLAVEIATVKPSATAEYLSVANSRFVAMNSAFDEFLDERRRLVVLAVKRQAEESRNRSVIYGIVGGVVIFVCILTLAFYISRILSRAIEDQINTLVEIGAQAGAQLPSGRRDEIGRMSQAIEAFKRTLAELRTSQAALQASHHELDNRVRERTQQLADSNERLRRSTEDLERYAFAASHDLQEPLRTITSYSQLLVQRYSGKGSPDADEYVAYVASAVRHMRELIDGLQAFVRVSHEREEFTPVNLNELLDDVFLDMKDIIGETHAEIEHDTLPTLKVNKYHITQLFQSLLSNAIKFRGDRTPVIVIRTRPGEKEWLFSVRDNGIGIDPKHHEYIFALFKRLHTREKYPGLGLGLAICRRVIQLHGGRMWVESHDIGSEFHFTLPT